MYIKSFILAALIAGCIPVCGFAAESPANPIVSDSYGSEEFIQDADIRLEPGETLKYVGGGDTARWRIDNAKTGRFGNTVEHILLKPLQNGISTNIVINTDRRSYQLIVEAGPAYNPMVSWIYPKSDTQIYEEQQTKSYSSIDPSQIKFGYKISDTHYKWSPVNVFHSEYKTYFKMKSDIKDTELPAVFVVDDDNKLLLVSYRFVDGYFIVDRVVDQAVFVLGGKKVKVKYRYED